MAVSLAQSCIPGTFSPSVFGAEILSLEANLVTNHSATAIESYRNTGPTIELENAAFCNVTVTYTHPGQNDSIVAEAWLPLEWNERLQAVGGGGWVAGRFFLSYGDMNGALSEGYATITTDAGIGSVPEASGWALLSPGNVNLYNLQNFGSVSLNDQSIIGKSLIKSFYGQDPKYSYFTGCSQGGRQGLVLAQRYPTAYDGIIAAAPAMYWNDLFTYFQWPQQIMNELGEYPRACEMDAITNAAVAACDDLDGVVDGVIANTDECLEQFDPFSVVGESVTCAQTNSTQVLISEAAATVVNATWHGRVTADGKRMYHGVNPGSDLTGNLVPSSNQPGLAATDCTGPVCKGAPSLLGSQWLSYFVAKNPDFDLSNLTRADFDALSDAGQQQFGTFMDLSGADLTRFRDAGGKILTFHGAADNIIPTKAIEEFYNGVQEIDSNVRDFFRLFEAPGLGHCWGGKSGKPTRLLSQLRGWVENGTVPESTPVKVEVENGETHNRILCPYPVKARFDFSCGDASSEACWSCPSPEL